MGIGNFIDVFADAMQAPTQDALDEAVAGQTTENTDTATDTETTYYDPWDRETSVNTDDFYAWMEETYPQFVEAVKEDQGLWNGFTGYFEEAGSPVAGTETDTDPATETGTDTETDTETATAAPDPTEQNYDIHDRTSDAWDEHGRWIPPDDNWRTTNYYKANKNKTGMHEKSITDFESHEAAINDGWKRYTWDELFGGELQWDIDTKGNDFRALIKSNQLQELFPTIEYDNVLNTEHKTDVYRTLGQYFGGTWQMQKIHTRGDTDPDPGKDSIVFDILNDYQDYYWGDEERGIEGFSPELREDYAWGLDIQRDWMSTQTYLSWDDVPSNEVFQQLIGRKSDGSLLNDYFDYGANIDARYYNASSHTVYLNAMRRHIFGEENYRQNYSTIEEVRDAWSLARSMSYEDLQRELDWAATYMTPYKLHQETAADSSPWTYHKSIRFDPETNTTSYYDPFVGLPKVDLAGNPITKTIEPIAEPQELLI